MRYPLFETLAIENGNIQRIEFHQQRYENSLRTFYGKNYQVFDLNKIIQIQTALGATQQATLIRCRIDYDQHSYQVQYFPYQRKSYRTFQPVFCDHIDYQLKFADRALLNTLLQQKGECDEIMIIKQGKVTDCSIGNLIFRQGQQWFTPQTPLLAGTQRAYLLAQGKIQPRDILWQELDQFEEIRLINAFNGL